MTAGVSQVALVHLVLADLRSSDPARHRAAIVRLLDYRGFAADSLVVLAVTTAPADEIARCRRDLLETMARAVWVEQMRAATLN